MRKKTETAGTSPAIGFPIWGVAMWLHRSSSGEADLWATYFFETFKREKSLSKMGFGWLDEGAQVSVYLADGDESDGVEVTDYGALEFHRKGFEK
jgi:hypothetical protein